jgi:hypothetical protein
MDTDKIKAPIYGALMGAGAGATLSISSTILFSAVEAVDKTGTHGKMFVDYFFNHFPGVAINTIETLAAYGFMHGTYLAVKSNSTTFGFLDFDSAKAKMRKSAFGFAGSVATLFNALDMKNTKDAKIEKLRHEAAQNKMETSYVPFESTPKNKIHLYTL